MQYEYSGAGVMNRGVPVRSRTSAGACLCARFRSFRWRAQARFDAACSVSLRGGRRRDADSDMTSSPALVCENKDVWKSFLAATPRRSIGNPLSIVLVLCTLQEFET